MDLSAQTVDKFQQLCAQLYGFDRSDLHAQFTLIDKYISREGDISSGSTVLRALNSSGRKNILRNIEVPVVYTKVDAEFAYQMGVFLTGFPIFGAVTSKEKVDIAVQMQALMGRDQQKFNWVGELSQVLRDGITYNLCAVETGWHRQFYTQSGRNTSGPAQLIKYQGNKISRIDPYNLLFDRAVLPSEVKEYGSYVGYVRQYNSVAIRALLQSMDDKNKILRNISEALRTTSQRTLFYQPTIRADVTPTGTDWAAFFGLPSVTGSSNATGFYEAITLYVRIIPKDFSIIAPRSGSPDIYKLFYVNDKLCYAERLDTELFPITICQPQNFGHGFQDKGFAENLLDIQDVSTSLQLARLKTLRRSVGDRAIYDSKMIAPHSMTQDDPEAKIPIILNSNKEKAPLSSAYYRIPFEDNMSGSYAQEFAMLNSFADDVSGINRAGQGNFVKGNKTLFEFDTVMQNSQARSQTRSIILEARLFYHIKEEIKENYLRYAQSESLFDRKTRNQTEIDPKQLQDAVVEFKISDGLLPSSKLINTETFRLAFEGMGTIPGFVEQYDAAAMFVHFLKNSGMEDLDDFKRQEPLANPGGSGGQPAGNSGRPGGNQA